MKVYDLVGEPYVMDEGDAEFHVETPLPVDQDAAADWLKSRGFDVV